jgi:hypothetical protein
VQFIIYAPRYSDTSGGTLVLYQLGDSLVKRGHNVKIWLDIMPTGYESGISRLKKRIRYYKYLLFKRKRLSNPFCIDRAGISEISNSVVVYPEIISGNPLRAERVCRWLLNTPGELSERYFYGRDDLFFHYMSHFFNTGLTAQVSVPLRVFRSRSEYYDRGLRRSGSCYQVRKCKNPDLSVLPDNSVPIDGLEHAEISLIFNTKEFFYSFDDTSFYTQLAAISGCKSIVVPTQRYSYERWMAISDGSPGVAYGISDLPRAIATRNTLIDNMNEMVLKSEHDIDNFIKTCAKEWRLDRI